MALFAEKDRPLPLLTHIYQLDASSKEEIFAFHNYFKRRSDSKGLANVFIEDMTSVELDYYVIAFGSVASLAKRMMTTLCDRQTVSERDWFELCHVHDNFYAIYPRPTVGNFIQSVIKADKEIPVTDLYQPMTPAGDTLIKLMVDHLWATVTQGQWQLLRRCEECENVFVRSRNHPDQEYCSARCTDRVFARRKRQRNRQILLSA